MCRIDLFSEVRTPFKWINRAFFALMIGSGLAGLFLAWFLYSAMAICDAKAKAAGMSWSFGEDGCKLEPKK